MKGKSTTLILICFAFVPINNGYRVRSLHEEVNNFPVDICALQSTKMFLPVARNCSLFYDCSTKEQNQCPQEMWFDRNYVGNTICQYPQVICAADNTVCDCPEYYPTAPPPPPLHSLTEPSVTCLKDNRIHFIPSRVSCSRYFVCRNDMRYQAECRQGLHYSDKTKSCEHPEVANCKIPDPECPSEGITFLPDSTRCEVFYVCLDGMKRKQICPFFHIWDAMLGYCRRQENDETICHWE